MTLVLHIPFLKGGNPYIGLEPFFLIDHDAVLAKGGSLMFSNHNPKTLVQVWSYVPALAHRWRDKRLAWEYMRFLDSLPSVRPGDTKILWVRSLPDVQPMPRRPRGANASAYAPFEEQKSDIVKWLTTYER